MKFVCKRLAAFCRRYKIRKELKNVASIRRIAHDSSTRTFSDPPFYEWSLPAMEFSICPSPSFRGCRQGAIVKEDKVVLIDDLVATGARAWVRGIRISGNLKVKVSLNRSISQSCSNMSQTFITNKLKLGLPCHNQSKSSVWKQSICKLVMYL